MKWIALRLPTCNMKNWKAIPIALLEGERRIDTCFSLLILEITAANLTLSEIKEKEQRHRELLEETVAVGMMFASKAFVQLLANPIVGPLTHK